MHCYSHQRLFGYVLFIMHCYIVSSLVSSGLFMHSYIFSSLVSCGLFIHCYIFSSLVSSGLFIHSYIFSSLLSSSLFVYCHIFSSLVLVSCTAILPPSGTCYGSILVACLFSLFSHCGILSSLRPRSFWSVLTMWHSLSLRFFPVYWSTATVSRPFSPCSGPIMHCCSSPSFVYCGLLHDFSLPLETWGFTSTETIKVY